MVSCSICFKQYDEVEHRPKVLSCCGHTFCLKCLLTMQASKSTAINCPKCNQQVSQRGASTFLDNFELISLIDQPVKQVERDSSRFFCLDCGKEATSACLDGHTLRGLARHREDRLQERKEAVADLERQVADALEKCVQLQSEELIDQELQLLRCQQPVTLSCDAWRAEAVELQRRPALRLALLQLLQEGELQRVDQTQPQTEEPHRQQPRVQKPQPQQEKVHDLPAHHKESSSSATLPFVDLDLQGFCNARPGELQKEKDSLLQCRVVHVLKGFDCSHDPDWIRAVLKRHAGTLQEVHLSNVALDHFLDLQRMPRLRKLGVALTYVPKTNPVPPPPPVRQNHPFLLVQRKTPPPVPQEWQGRLEWLHVEGLRKETTLATLRAHRDSLRELVLWVGPPPEPGAEESWPETCSGLHSLLLDCGLRKLSSVTLRRWHGVAAARVRTAIPCTNTCSCQLVALRAALPHCKFACSNH